MSFSYINWDYFLFILTVLLQYSASSMASAGETYLPTFFRDVRRTIICLQSVKKKIDI